MNKALYKQKNGNGGSTEPLEELWNPALALRGNIWPADHASYVLQQEK
jgi:hypothetical protein